MRVRVTQDQTTGWWKVEVWRWWWPKWSYVSGSVAKDRSDAVESALFLLKLGGKC